MLTEAERNILLDPTQTVGTAEQELAARSLVGSKRDVRGSATINRTVFGNVSGTLNTELEHSEGRSLIGLNPSLLEPLARNTDANSAHLGGVAQRHDQVAMALDGDRQCRPRREHRRAPTATAPASRSTARARPPRRATSRRPPTAICSSFPRAMRPPP